MGDSVMGRFHGGGGEERVGGGFVGGGVIGVSAVGGGTGVAVATASLPIFTIEIQYKMTLCI